MSRTIWKTLRNRMVRVEKMLRLIWLLSNAKTLKRKEDANLDTETVVRKHVENLEAETKRKVLITKLDQRRCRKKTKDDVKTRQMMISKQDKRR